ncbi:MAG TPA: MMPL family transporter [Candidatus Binatia bacterium]|nr:MMPL family transporter [Candidatus Binatia bacterium]
MHGDARGKFSQLFIKVTEPIVFGHRLVTLTVVGLVTLFMVWEALHLKTDAGFEKQLPLGHPYIQVFKQYEREFGGANLLLLAMVQKNGDIYDAAFMDSLHKLTDAVFFAPGVDRARVSSLFTPDVRYIEVIEDGFAGGNVIPAEYAPTQEMLQQIKRNVGKANILGRLVTNDQTGAMVFSELLERDPVTEVKLDYVRAAHVFEDIRGRFTHAQMYEYKLKGDHPPFKAGEVVARTYSEPGRWWRVQTVDVANPADATGPMLGIRGWELELSQASNPDYNPNVSVHVIGFAKVIGDISDATLEVVAFFGLTLLLTLILLWQYCGSLRIAMIPLSCSVLAVIWELGMLHLFGYGLDPFAILVPFLVLAIGVSHGVQITSFWLYEVADHERGSFEASRATYRRLVIPGISAVLTNVVGFGTILLVPIQVVQEMAINAMFGLVAIIVCKKILLPCLLSYASLPDPKSFREHQKKRDALFEPAWRVLSGITLRPVAMVVLAAAVALSGWAWWVGQRLAIGELHAGVPELRPDSRYNLDSAVVASKFSIGVDIMKVIAEAPADSCIDHASMQTIDEYAWRMENTAGVQSTLSLPKVSKIVYTAFNESNPKWSVLPRNRDAMVTAVQPFPPSSGLLNTDCSAMPVLMFTADHKAETIDRIVAATNDFAAGLPKDSAVHLKLATGNVGVMAAANDVIKATDHTVLFWVYAGIAVCVLLSFRSVAGLICVLVPLALVSVFSYAVMVFLQIGIKVSTLPVAAFAAGIGVDYGIYIFSVLEECVNKGMPLRQAYEQTLHQTGKAVVFTGLALAASVCTWMLSNLQFQVDMGILLTIMFLANAVAAVLLLPAFAAFLLKPDPVEAEPAAAVK